MLRFFFDVKERFIYWSQFVLVPKNFWSHKLFEYNLLFIKKENIHRYFFGTYFCGQEKNLVNFILVTTILLLTKQMCHKKKCGSKICLVMPGKKSFFVI